MKIKELVGKNIMMAYDGNYLSKDFGYSCANFNTSWWGGIGNDNWRFFDAYQYKLTKKSTENDEATFDFYTMNTKNVSCFVAFNEVNKICGRRMFFKGKSLTNDDEFDVPLKKGQLVKYLYGYYGQYKEQTRNEIGKAVLNKYGKGIIYTDSVVLRNGAVDELPNYWIMGVERTDFEKYPPIDHLLVSTELNALSNFQPKQYIIDVLEKDFKVENIEFHGAYRFDPKRKGFKHSYTTWDQHKGLFNPQNVTIEEDEKESWVDDLKEGDKVKSKTGKFICIFDKKEEDGGYIFVTENGVDITLTKMSLENYFEKA
jgi:hypothetical protein